MLKAVLDTNVLISDLLSSDGIPNQLLRQAKLTYQLFISREILEEVRDVLLKPKIQRKMSLTEDKILAFLSTIQKVAIGESIYELRIHYGPGYRIYFGDLDGVIIILLCGGTKRTQNQDINKAREY
jgi:putative addiction module killer protein